MVEDSLLRIASELGAVVEATTDPQLTAQDARRVLRFVARVAHVVEQALQDVYGLAIEVKHVSVGDKQEIGRLQRELDLVCSRSEYSKAEEICSRLRHLREHFEQDVALLLRCSRGDARWQQLFWLLEEREGRIIELVNDCTRTMGDHLQALSESGWTSRSQAGARSAKAADDAARAIHGSLRQLREIRDRIFGVSGQEGFLELTEADPGALRTQAHALNVQISTGDIYKTDIAGSTVGAVAIAAASAQGTVGSSRPPGSR